MSIAVESAEGVMAAGNRQSARQTLDPLDQMVLRVRSGDIDAFDEIMQATEGRVLGLAWRLLGDRELARDASQDAFLRAFKALASYRIGESFTAWIGRITANVCFDQMKKRDHAVVDPLVLESIPSPESYNAENAALHSQRMEIVQNALSTLTPAERSALVLREMEGLSTDETARVLGLQASTVRVQISSALSKVKIFCQRVLSKPKRPIGGHR